MMKFHWIAIVVFAFGSLAGCAGTGFGSASEDVIYLVRHAEKEPGPDPDLSPAGQTRALALADRLSKARLTAIYSTNTKRTRQTAAPIAQRLNIPILYYDPRQLDLFADQLKAEKGQILVVGHSNTTPNLVAALGGAPGSPIVEASEYDRLYVLMIDADGVETELQRYGEASPR